MRLAFLLGAGVSLPAGMPSTEALTSSVLNTKSEDCEADRLLQQIRQECENYFKRGKRRGTGRRVNYEDLFFAASQLSEHLLEEYENPALEAFTTTIAKKLRPAGREDLRDKAETACYHIREVVFRELSRAPRVLDHLKVVVEALTDSAYVGSDIFTLNHDTLIESALDTAGIAYTDGFGQMSDDVSFWDAKLLERPTVRHLLLKLHGSVNWREFRGRLAKGGGDSPEDIRFGSECFADRQPVMLMGTFNKIRDYFATPYSDLIVVLRRQLELVDHLVVSGYSFGDKGINLVIYTWLNAVSSRRLLVLHQKGEKCIDGGRGAIRKLWDVHGNERMLVENQYLTDCDWRSLRRRLA